jgi:hypothetical protein
MTSTMPPPAPVNDDMDFTLASSKRTRNRTSTESSRDSSVESISKQRRARKNPCPKSATPGLVGANMFAPLAAITVHPLDQAPPKAALSTPPSKNVPPLMVRNQTTHSAMLNLLLTVVPRDKFTITPRLDFSAVRVNNISDYRLVTDLLEERKIEHYTFSSEPLKTQTFILRGLPINTETDTIKSALLEIGFPARTVTQLTFTRLESRPKMPLFRVTLARKPGELAADLTTLTRLLSCVVSCEAPKPTLLQQTELCYNCQMPGHSARFCKVAPRCAKCAGRHQTRECKLKSSDKRTCANCSGAHPSTYQNCPHLRDVRERRALQAKGQRPNQQAALTTSEPTPRLGATTTSLGAALPTARQSRDAPPRRLEMPAQRSFVTADRSYAMLAANLPSLQRPSPTVTEPPPSPPCPPPPTRDHVPPPSASSFSWQSLALSFAQFIANLNFHPILTMLAQSAVSFLTTIQNASP